MIRRFFEKNPALFYSLNILFGCYLALNKSFAALIPLFLLLLFFRKGYIKLLLALLVFASSFIYVITYYEFPQITSENIYGTAHFKIESIQKTKSFFGSSFLYKGTVKTFDSNGLVAKNIPCSIYLPQKVPRKNANYSYFISGILKKGKGYRYILKPDKKIDWVPIKKNGNLAEFRFLLKQKLKKKIQKSIKNKRSATFLSSIATGEFSDPLMFFNLNRLGLQHIMAISGFHFAIIAAFLNLFLCCFLSPKKTAVILIICLSSYFIFIGGAVSVKRAWISVVVALLGLLIERTARPLNTLGVALIAVLVHDPIVCLNLGFKLSFLATASILLLYPLLRDMFASKNYSEVIKMGKFKQICAIFSSIFMKTVALTIAIHLITVPIVLQSFHKFPLLSIFYNVFFPFLISISIILLLMSIPFFYIFPPVASIFCSINNFYTNAILNLSSEMPNTLNFVIRVSPVPDEILIAYIAALFFIGIILLEKRSYAWGQS